MALILARPNQSQLVLTATDVADPAGAIDDLIALFTAARQITASPNLTPAAIAAATEALATIRAVATELTASPTSPGDLMLTGQPDSVAAFIPLLGVIANVQSAHTDTE